MLTAVAMDDVMEDLRQLAADLLSADSDEEEVTWPRDVTPTQMLVITVATNDIIIIIRS